MALKDFINKFDKDNSAIPLEGKRTVQEGDREKLRTLGKLLALNTTRMNFRSGNAECSDQHFSEGSS